MTSEHATTGRRGLAASAAAMGAPSGAVLATGADGTALRFDAVALPVGADLGAYARLVGGSDPVAGVRCDAASRPAGTLGRAT